MERCDQFDCFIFNHAIEGGTGGGFYDLVSSFLSDSNPKNWQINFAVFPSENYSDSQLGFYNSLLSLPSLHQNSKAVITFENEKLYNFC